MHFLGPLPLLSTDHGVEKVENPLSSTVKGLEASLGLVRSGSLSAEMKVGLACVYLSACLSACLSFRLFRWLSTLPCMLSRPIGELDPTHLVWVCDGVKFRGGETEKGVRGN